MGQTRKDGKAAKTAEKRKEKTLFEKSKREA